MFLSTALKEKLKRDFLEGGTDEQEGAKFRYEPHSPDKRMLINFHETIKTTAKDPTPFIKYNSQQLKSLEKEEWENTFTLKNLRARWKGYTNLDFDNNFKKFTDDVIPTSVKNSKKYVKELIDPDILENKPKQFNLSTDTGKEVRPELRKTIFEVSQGLKNFNIVPLKEHNINEGVDSRNHLTLDNNTWNTSNLIDKNDFNDKYKEDLVLAQDNSFRYWKENEDNRNMESQYPIRKEREKVEIPRYFKKYRNPFQRSIDYYHDMNKIKENSTIEKENVEKIILHDHPYLKKCPEKLNALVLREMNGIYKNKYDEFISRSLQLKRSEEAQKKNSSQKYKFKWNDADLSNKIIAINKLEKSGILKTDSNVNNRYNRLCLSFDKNRKDSLLPLVIKGQSIFNEEDKIEEKLREEKLKQQKKELLLLEKQFKRVATPKKFISKYPLNKEEYEINKKIESFNTIDNSNMEEVDKKILINKFSKTPSKKRTEEIMNEISKSSGCGPHFLEAYCKIANKELEKIKERNKKEKEKVTVKYIHPGTYRAFSFVERTIKPKPEKKKDDFDIDDGFEKKQEPDEYIEKKVKEYYWSCCMNTDKDSRGCQKIEERNFKYLYN